MQAVQSLRKLFDSLPALLDALTADAVAARGRRLEDSGVGPEPPTGVTAVATRLRGKPWW